MNGATNTHTHYYKMHFFSKSPSKWYMLNLYLTLPEHTSVWATGAEIERRRRIAKGKEVIPRK